jgi:hypothetical protein
LKWFNPATIRAMYCSTAADRRKIGRAFADGKGALKLFNPCNIRVPNCFTASDGSLLGRLLLAVGGGAGCVSWLAGNGFDCSIGFLAFMDAARRFSAKGRKIIRFPDSNRRATPA